MRIGQVLPLIKLQGLVELLNRACDDPDLLTVGPGNQLTRAVELIELYLNGDIDMEDHFCDDVLSAIYDELLCIFGINVYGMSDVFKFYVNYNFRICIILRY